MSLCRNCGDPLPPPRGTTPRTWCSDRCRKAAARNGRALAAEMVPDLPPVGSIREAVETVVAVVDYAPEDPRAVIARMALALGAEMDRNPTPHMAREIRHMLSDLTDSPNEPATFVDELRARRAARVAEGMLGDEGRRRRSSSGEEL